MATAEGSELAWRVGDRARALKLFERAYQCQLAGDLAGAVHLYQASLAELPTAEAHTFLGWVYSFERRYDEAIAECKRAIAVDPTFGNPYNDIGCYLIELRRDDDAIPWLKRPMDAPRYEAPHVPHVNLARIYEKNDQVLDALAEYGRALDKMPGYDPATPGSWPVAGPRAVPAVEPGRAGACRPRTRSPPGRAARLSRPRGRPAAFSGARHVAVERARGVQHVLVLYDFAAAPGPAAG